MVICIHSKYAIYETKGLNLLLLDVEYDAKEVKKVLDDLISEMKDEISNKIAEWKKDGKKVLASKLIFVNMHIEVFIVTQVLF